MNIFISDLSKIKQKESFIKKFSKYLTVRDKVRFDKISACEHKLQFLVGRIMIYRFLGRRFKIEKSGKLTHKSSFLSLTHSNNLVALALSKSPIGIDTENTSKKRNFKSICKFLNLKNCSNLSEFYMLFTKFEADFKLGKQFKNPHNTFLLWNNFVICVSTPHKESSEFFEYIPD